MDEQSIWIMFIYVFFCKTVLVNLVLYSLITLLHVISSFQCNFSSFVQYVYVSIEPIDCIILISLVLIEILLTSSVNTSCSSLLNLCYCFNINLLFFMNSLQFSLKVSISTLFILVYFVFNLTCF